jgi:hypothetical protein
MTDQPEHPGIAGLAERVLSLGHEVDSLRRMTDTQRDGLRDVRARVDDQHGDLTEHATALAGLRTALAGLAEQVAELARDEEEEQARAASWFEMADPALAIKRLTSLITWLDRVYIRFPGAELPGCWLWHPPVVEELLWLQRAWTEAYHGRSAATFRVADWHDRQRPNVVRRITEYAGRCALAEHVPTGERTTTTPPRVLTAEAADDVARAWTADRSAPYPTPDQLADEREATR